MSNIQNGFIACSSTQRVCHAWIVQIIVATQTLDMHSRFGAHRAGIVSYCEARQGKGDRDLVCERWNFFLMMHECTCKCGKTLGQPGLKEKGSVSL